MPKLICAGAISFSCSYFNLYFRQKKEKKTFCFVFLALLLTTLRDFLKEDRRTFCFCFILTLILHSGRLDPEDSSVLRLSKHTFFISFPDLKKKKDITG